MEFCDIIIAAVVILSIVLLCTLIIDNKPAPIEEPKPFEPKPIKPERTTAKSLYANPPVYKNKKSDYVDPDHIVYRNSSANTTSPEIIIASILIADAISDGECKPSYTKPYVPVTSYDTEIMGSYESTKEANTYYYEKHKDILENTSSSSDSSSDSDSSSSSGGCD